MKKLQFFCVGILLVICVQCSEKELWKTFKSKYKKSYETLKEENLRFKVFRNNLQLIEEHNKKFAQGLESYNLSSNHFMDKTTEEFYTQYDHNPLYFGNASIPTEDYYVDEPEELATFSNESYYNLPKNIDWRKKGAVSEVKDQLDCGSCWAFSITGALEGFYYMKNKKVISLSPQSLVDCAYKEIWPEYNSCSGGQMTTGFAHAKHHGIASEKDYPYIGSGSTNTTKICKKYEPAIKFTGMKTLNSNETDLQIAVSKYGPISVSLVWSPKLQFYHKGIFFDEDCLTYNKYHAVLVVGYGTDNGTDYWLIKNSWNTDWGDHGYFKMARNRNNHCRITHNVHFPY